MKVVLLLITLFVFTTQMFGQNFKYVNASSLNIRDSAGTQFGVAGKATLDEKVTIVKEIDGWSQIITKNGTKGFVQTKYLTSKVEQEHNNESYKSTAKSNSNTIWDKILGWFIILGIISISIAVYLYNRRCNRCGKWNVMESIGSELVDEKASTITKTEKVKNSRGEVIRTKERFVPATVYTYHHHRKCKQCGYKDIIVKTKKSEN